MAQFESIDIPGIGKIRVPVRGFASEETLETLANALGGSVKSSREGLKSIEKPAKEVSKEMSAIAKVSKAAQEAIAKKTKAEEKAAKAADEAAKAQKRYELTVGRLQKAFNAVGSALVGASGMAKAIMRMNGSFSSLSGVIDQTVRTIQDSFLGRLPVFGKMISDAAYATGEMTKLQLEFMDMQRGAFVAISQSGRSAAVNLEEFTMSVFDANINLEKFMGVFANNIDGLRIAFGSVESVQRNFINNLQNLTNPESGIGMSLRILGLNAEGIAEEFADFMTVNRRNRLLMNIGETELNEAVKERAKNERILAEFTGQSVQEQRQQQMALMGDMAFQAALMSKVPAEFRDEMTQLTAGLSKYGLGDFSKQILGFDSILGGGTEMIAAAIPGMADAVKEAQQAVMNGTEPSIAMGPVLELARANIDKLLPLVQLGLIPGGEQFVQALGDLTGGALEIDTQLANLNKMMGTDFAEIGQAMTAFNKKYNMDMMEAEKLAGEFEKAKLGNTALTLDQFLEARGYEAGQIDESVLKMVAQNAKLEEATGTLQKNVFAVTTNFRGLADITLQLTSGFANLLDKMGMGSVEEIMRQSQGITTTQVRKGHAVGVKYFLPDGTEAIYDEASKRYVPKRESGGPVGGGLYMVGERGPELLAMDKGASGYVYNNSQTRALMGMATPRYSGGPVGKTQGGEYSGFERTAIKDLGMGGYMGSGMTMDQLFNILETTKLRGVDDLLLYMQDAREQQGGLGFSNLMNAIKLTGNEKTQSGHTLADYDSMGDFYDALGGQYGHILGSLYDSGHASAGGAGGALFGSHMTQLAKDIDRSTLNLQHQAQNEIRNEKLYGPEGGYSLDDVMRRQEEKLRNRSQMTDEEVINLMSRQGGGPVVGELKNLNKMLKTMLGKAYSGNGYF